MSNTSKGRATKGSKLMIQMAASPLQKHIIDEKLGEEDIKTYTDRIKREGQEQIDKLIREAEEREKKFNKGVSNHELGIDEGVSSVIT